MSRFDIHAGSVDIIIIAVIVTAAYTFKLIVIYAVIEIIEILIVSHRLVFT